MFLIWYFLILNLGYLLLLLVAIPDIIRKYQETKLGNIQSLTQSSFLPPVTAIVPAYNEEEGIIDTLTSLLNVDYENFEIIVVDDGSTDNTLQFLRDKYDLFELVPIIPQRIKTTAKINKFYKSKIHPNLTVIAKEHSGKSESLNIAINACRSPIFVSIDSDSIIEPNTINLLIFSMLSQSHVIAEGGAVFVLNGCEVINGKIIETRLSYSPLVALQVCEYLRAFYFGRSGWRTLGGPLILSGTIAFFERQVVIEAGGFKLDSPGEDMELILRLNAYMHEHNYPYKIYFSPVPIIWTHVPTSVNELWAQRDRWQRGQMDSLFSHFKMLFNKKYGVVGFFSFPFNLFGEFLGPILEFLGYIAFAIALYLNVVNWKIAILFFIACWGLSTIFTLGVALLNIISFNKYKRPTDTLWMLLIASLEMFGYRQILTFCRSTATVRYIFHKIFYKEKNLKTKNSWN